MRLLRGAGDPLLELDPDDRQLLSLLLDELTALLDGSAADDEVIHRLNPAAYRDDPAAEAEFRDLTEAGLRSGRDERMAACRADLAAGADIDLADPDIARRWLQVLNDLRLALGTRLGVTQDADRQPDPADPVAGPWLLYSWLTELQDVVVSAVLP